MPPSNLPQPLTSFIGRERDIAELIRLLSHSRLLTLTGAGGCGKTRLALEVAGEMCRGGSESRPYADGVWLVELAPLGDAALVPQAVATALGMRLEGNRTAQEALLAELGSKRVLL